MRTEPFNTLADAESYVNGHFFGFTQKIDRDIKDLVYYGMDANNNIIIAIWKEYIDNELKYFVSDFKEPSKEMNNNYEKICKYLAELDTFKSNTEISAELFSKYRIPHSFTRFAVVHLSHIGRIEKRASVCGSTIMYKHLIQ